MVVVSADTPVTNPVLFTEAIAALMLPHVPPVVASDSWVVPPIQTALVPVMAATVGKALTANVVVVVRVQPLALGAVV